MFFINVKGNFCNKKTPHSVLNEVFFMYEADNRDRTGGLRITSASLYLLSHIGKLYYSIRYKSVCQIKILR